MFTNAVGTDETDVTFASFSQDSSGKLTVEFTATVDIACADRFYVGIGMGTIRPKMEIRIQFGLQDYLRKTSFSEALKSS